MLSTIEGVCADFWSEEVRDDINCSVVQAKKYIWAWETQQFRKVNQDQAKYDVISYGLGHEVLAAEVSRITVRIVC